MDSRLRAEAVHGQGYTEVIFHPRGRWLEALKLAAFLAVWVFGAGFGAVLASLADAAIMVWLWLAIWLIVGLFVVYVLVWRLLGVESLIARPQTLTLMRRLLLFAFPKDVPAASVTDLRWIADDPARRVRVNGRTIPQPAIEIVSEEAGVLRCASGIGEAEARQAIGALRQRLGSGRRHRDG